MTWFLCILLFLFSSNALAQPYLPGEMNLGQPNLGLLYNQYNKPKSVTGSAVDPSTGAISIGTLATGGANQCVEADIDGTLVLSGDACGTGGGSLWTDEGTYIDVPSGDAARAAIQDKGGQVFDVRAYGALCDGVTDDIAAIQAAENAADDSCATNFDCGTVLIPAATCLISNSLIVSSGVTIAGVGPASVLKASSGLVSEPFIESETDPASDGLRDQRIVVRDLMLDGSSSGASSIGILLRSVIDGAVENVVVKSPTFDCVYIGSGSTKTVRPLRNTVHNIHCMDAGRQGIAITGGVQLVISDNHIDSPAMHGIDLELEITTNMLISGVSITGNVIEDTDASASMCGIALTADEASQVIKDVTISGNTINDPGRGVCFRQTTNLVIDGNVIRSPSDDGIHSTVLYNAPVDTVISNNMIVDAAGYGIRWTRNTSSLISGNYIKNTTAQGIAISAGAGTVLSGNIIDTTGGTTDCVSIGGSTDGNATDIVVTGNSLYNCPDAGISLGGVTGTVTGTVIVGNVIEADNECVTDSEGGVGVDNTTVVGNQFTTCTTQTALSGASSVSMNRSGAELKVDEGNLRVTEDIQVDGEIGIGMAPGPTIGSVVQQLVASKTGAAASIAINCGSSWAEDRLVFAKDGNTEMARIGVEEGSQMSINLSSQGKCSITTTTYCTDNSDCTGGETCNFADMILRAGTSDHDLIIDGTTGNVSIDKNLLVYGADTNQYITMDVVLDVPTIYGSGAYLRIGDAAATGHSLISEDDLLVTGKLEVDGLSYFDSALTGPIQDKGGQVFNVKAYDAVGDGITDDTDEIKAMLDAASHCAGGTNDWMHCNTDSDCTGGGECMIRRGSFYFPAGTYLFTDELTFTKITANTAGAVFEGAGADLTTLLFDPSVADKWAFVLNDGTGSEDVRYFTFRNLTIEIVTPAAGAVKLTDPTNHISFENVSFQGYGTTTGVGVQMSGDDSCICHNEFHNCLFRNLATGIRFSGLANANLVSGGWCGVAGTCLDFSALSPDTTGGDSNLIERFEMDSSTTLGINLGAGADENRFVDVVSDGTTDALNMDTTATDNLFVGCALSNANLSSAEYAGITSVKSRWGEERPEFAIRDQLETRDSSISTIDGSLMCVTESGGLVDAAAGIGRIQNYVKYSEAFDNAAWQKGLDVTVTANIGTAPNGTTTADNVTYTSGINPYFRQIDIATGSPTLSRIFTACIWVKERPTATETTAFRIKLYDSGGTIDDNTYDPSPDWERLCVTGVGLAAASNNVNLAFAESTTSAYDLLVWGASVEESPAPGVYASTTSTAITTATWGLHSETDAHFVKDVQIDGSRMHVATDGGIVINGDTPWNDAEDMLYTPANVMLAIKGDTNAALNEVVGVNLGFGSRMGNGVFAICLDPGNNCQINPNIGLSFVISNSSTGPVEAARIDAAKNFRGLSNISADQEVRAYGGDADDYVVLDVISNVPSIYADDKYLRIGDSGATGHGLSANDDLLVTGKLEVDGEAYFDAGMYTGGASVKASSGKMYFDVNGDDSDRLSLETTVPVANYAIHTFDTPTSIMTNYVFANSGGGASRIETDSVNSGRAGMSGMISLYKEQGDSDYTTSLMPSSLTMSSHPAFYLPPDDGDAGEQLTTDGSGVLTWEAPGGTGGGDNITVNGTAVTDANFNDSDPAAPAGGVNIKWGTPNTTPNPDNVSAYVPFRLRPTAYTDFLNPQSTGVYSFSPFYGTYSGSATFFAVSGDNNHPGIADLRDSTSTSALAAVGTSPNALYLSGSEWYELVFRLPTTPVATNWLIRFGFSDNIISRSDPTGGCLFVLGGNPIALTGKCYNDGVSASTAAFTYNAGASGEWYRAVVSFNSDASQADFTLYNLTDADPPTQTKSLVDSTCGYCIANEGSTDVLGASLLATENTNSAMVSLIRADWMALGFGRDLAR